MELMNYKTILEKYFEGSSSLEEESQLKEFLNTYQGNDAEMLEAKEMFKFFTNQQKETVGIDFESVIKQKTNLKMRRLFRISSGVAASIVIGLSLMFLLKTNNTPVVYAYVNGQPITNKELALKYSKQALATVSTNLNKGTEGFNYMNKMNKPLELLTVKKQ